MPTQTGVDYGYDDFEANCDNGGNNSSLFRHSMQTLIIKMTIIKMVTIITMIMLMIVDDDFNEGINGNEDDDDVR